MLITSKSRMEIDRLKAQLGEDFEMKDMHIVKKIMGMDIRRERSSHRLSLSHKG